MGCSEIVPLTFEVEILLMSAEIVSIFVFAAQHNTKIDTISLTSALIRKISTSNVSGTISLHPMGKALAMA